MGYVDALQRKWQKEQELRREIREREEKLGLKEKTKQEEEGRQRLRDEFPQADPLLRTDQNSIKKPSWKN